MIRFNRLHSSRISHHPNGESGDVVQHREQQRDAARGAGIAQVSLVPEWCIRGERCQFGQGCLQRWARVQTAGGELLHAGHADEQSGGTICWAAQESAGQIVRVRNFVEGYLGHYFEMFQFSFTGASNTRKISVAQLGRFPIWFKSLL